MRKLSNTEAEFKKNVSHKKSEYFVGASNDPLLAVGVKAYLIYFLFLREFEVVFARIVKTSVSSV